MSTRAPVLLLRSANRNFPLDLEPELAAAGYEVTCASSLSEYIASPTRSRAQLVIIEIGIVDELDRAVLLVDWTEHVQPLAPARYLLLVASKNLQIGDRAVRLGPAEIVVLPQPARNILFKLELQSRLLTAPAKKTESAAASGFVAKLEEVHGPSRKRVLAVRGRDPKQGSWRDSGNTPSGKVRWRWVSAPGLKTPETSFTWTAVSETAPRFEEKAGAWLLEGEGDDLVCESNGEKVYSALEAVPEAKEERKESSGRSEPFVLPVDVSAKKGEEPAAGARPRHEHAEKEAAAKTFRSDEASPEAPALRQEAAPRSPAEKISIQADGQAGDKPAPEQRFAKEPREKTSAPAPADADEESEAPPAAAGPVPKAVRSAAERAKAALAQAEAALGETKAATGGTGTPAPAPWHNREAEGRDPVKREVNVHAGSGASAPVTEKNRIEGAPKAAPFPAETVSSGRSAEAGANALSPAEREAPAAREPAPKPTPREPAPRTQDVSPKARAEREPLPSLGDPVPDITATMPDPGNDPVPREKREPAPERAAPEGAPATASRSEPAPGLPQQPALKAKPEAAPAPKAPEPKFRSDSVAVQSAASRVSPDPAGGTVIPSAATLKSPLEPGQRAEPETRVQPAAPVAEEKRTVKAQPAPEPGETRITGSKPAAAEEDSRRFLKHRHFELMTLVQLGDRESSWHPVGRYRIYLSAQHRYYGLKHPQAALPLWVYDGELAPEFIDEQGAWKFYDRLPISVAQLEALPAEVLEHLYRICGLPVPSDAAPKAPGPAVVFMPGGGLGNGETKAQAAPAPEHDPYMPESRVAKKSSVWGTIAAAVKKVLGKS